MPYNPKSKKNLVRMPKLPSSFSSKTHRSTTFTSTLEWWGAMTPSERGALLFELHTSIGKEAWKQEVGRRYLAQREAEGVLIDPFMDVNLMEVDRKMRQEALEKAARRLKKSDSEIKNKYKSLYEALRVGARAKKRQK